MRKWRRFVFAFGFNLRAHQTERLDDATHRALREGAIADQPACERLAGEHPGEQPHGRAGVAAINFGFRRG